jgi:hypothetical protein
LTNNTGAQWWINKLKILGDEENPERAKNMEQEGIEHLLSKLKGHFIVGITQNMDGNSEKLAKIIPISIDTVKADIITTLTLVHDKS